MKPSAKVVADSIYQGGPRLTSLEVVGHRFVLAEANTHRVFSRNSASSRAIPAAKQRRRVAEEEFEPVEWPSEQKGMQGGAEVPDVEAAREEWQAAMQDALGHAETLAELGVHKSLANRLIEPYASHTMLITSTAWENFFHQRCSPLAQPEIRAMAEAMREAMEASEPRVLQEGTGNNWHLPYITAEDKVEELEQRFETRDPALISATLAKISAARCARVSYLTQDGVRDIDKDLELYERLTTAEPVHWSPLEHVATPWAKNRQHHDFGWTGEMSFTDMDGSERGVETYHLPRVGNLLGWRSLRTTVEAEQAEVTFR